MMSAKEQTKLKRKPGAKDPATITPEYIAEQRRQRELKKQQKKKQQAATPTEVPEHLKFIKRELLDLPGQTLSQDGFQVMIMSYNVLAQALIRRELFPTSGLALKWGTRSQVLLSEFKHYDADIICLQEVDALQYESFWKPQFDAMGYDSRYHKASTKNHGVAIIYKKSKFSFQNEHIIHHDDADTKDVPSVVETRNVGLLVHLKINDEILTAHPSLTKSGILVGTTHLFWHPFGTYERTRQMYILLQEMKEFENTLKLLHGDDSQFYKFLAGDFNSQPFDSPYLSVTAKPIVYEKRAKMVLGRAISHQWGQASTSAEDDEKTDDNPVPTAFQFNEDHLETIEKMQNLHNSIDQRCISLYSVGYKQVHPENSGLDNDRNEPIFSNWAHTWRGLLDYIFVVTKWDGQPFQDRIDEPSDLALEQHIKLLGLLRLPTKEEMGPEPSGQPRAGQYPSDHLCLLAKIELC